jgi:dipeptidyl aminopeptidase/acylaminoacyl peptidase
MSPHFSRAALASGSALLTAGAFAASAHAAFPGTNGRVAFESQPRIELTGLYSFNGAQILTSAADGTDIKPLVDVSDDEWEAHDPVWSADGKWLAYVLKGRNQENQGFEEIHVIGSDGSDDRDLPAPSMRVGMPAFSPDGQWIAFVNRDDRALWVVKADGSAPATEVPLGESEGNVANPQWSPDGKWIAFDGIGSENGRDIFVVAAAGGEPKAVAGDGNDEWEDMTRPNWAPDGSAIVFAYDADGGTAIMDVPVKDGDDTGAMTELADEHSYEDVDFDDLGEPAYSPDGKVVVFSASRWNNQSAPGLLKIAQFGAQGLFTIPAAGLEGGAAPTPFAGDEDAFYRAPDWQPVPAAKPVPVASQPPVVSTGGVAGQQQRRCGSRRHFTIRLRPRGEKLAMARVIVNGKRVKVKPGRRWTAVVDLRSLPKKRFKVDITVWTKSGKRYHEVRRYWTCTAARRS